MRFEQVLFERFVNVFTPEDKRAYMDDVWQLLELTYAEIGGLMGAGSRIMKHLINRGLARTFLVLTPTLRASIKEEFNCKLYIVS